MRINKPFSKFKSNVVDSQSRGVEPCWCVGETKNFDKPLIVKPLKYRLISRNNVPMKRLKIFKIYVANIGYSIQSRQFSVFAKLKQKGFLTKLVKLLNRSGIIASCRPDNANDYINFFLDCFCLKFYFKFCRFHAISVCLDVVRQIWEGCDGFLRNPSVSAQFGDLSDFAYALIGVLQRKDLITSPKRQQ